MWYYIFIYTAFLFAGKVSESMKVTYILWAGILIAAVIDMVYELKRHKKLKAEQELQNVESASRIGMNKKNKKKR